MILDKVYCADALDFLTKLENDSIDLAIIDPPYNLNKGKWDSFNSEEEYFSFTFDWIDLLIPKLKHTASLYLFNTAFNSAIILNYLNSKKLVFRNWITWYKKDGFSYTTKKFANSQETLLFFSKSNSNIFNYDDVRIPYLSTDRMYHAQSKGILKNGKRWFPNPKGKLCGDVWEITSQRHKQKINGKVQTLSHPTTKPYEMIERIIKASSNENDLVLDLFSGSGTTSLVAKNLNRRFIGCELNEEYISNIEGLGLEIERL